jgi:hypothetical protein
MLYMATEYNATRTLISLLELLSLRTVFQYKTLAMDKIEIRTCF